MFGDIYEGSDVKVKINLRASGFDQSSDGYIIKVFNDSDELTFTQDDVKPDGNGNYFLPIPYDRIHSGSLIVQPIALVHDEDFAEGIRRIAGVPVNIGPVRKVKR